MNKYLSSILFVGLTAISLGSLTARPPLGLVGARCLAVWLLGGDMMKLHCPPEESQEPMKDQSQIIRGSKDC